MPTALNDLDKHASTSGSEEFLIFKVGSEEYAVDILSVQEIRGYDSVTALANTPDFIKGVINLRGVIVPIVDLRIKFRHPAEYGAFTVVVILNILKRVIGVVVDGVSDVVVLSPEQIRPAPDFSAQIDTRYIRGLASHDGRMLIVADIQKLMSAKDMALLDVIGD